MNDLIVVGKLGEWKRLKALVLDSVSSRITRRLYIMALDEFMEWYREEPRPGSGRGISRRPRRILIEELAPRDELVIIEPGGRSLCVLKGAYKFAPILDQTPESPMCLRTVVICFSLILGVIVSGRAAKTLHRISQKPLSHFRIGLHEIHS